MESVFQVDTQTAMELRVAAKECSERGLIIAAKWCDCSWLALNSYSDQTYQGVWTRACPSAFQAKCHQQFCFARCHPFLNFNASQSQVSWARDFVSRCLFSHVHPGSKPGFGDWDKSSRVRSSFSWPSRWYENMRSWTWDSRRRHTFRRSYLHWFTGIFARHPSSQGWTECQSAIYQSV